MNTSAPVEAMAKWTLSWCEAPTAAESNHLAIAQTTSAKYRTDFLRTEQALLELLATPDSSALSAKPVVVSDSPVTAAKNRVDQLRGTHRVLLEAARPPSRPNRRARSELSPGAANRTGWRQDPPRSNAHFDIVAGSDFQLVRDPRKILRGQPLPVCDTEWCFERPCPLMRTSLLVRQKPPPEPKVPASTQRDLRTAGQYRRYFGYRAASRARPARENAARRGPPKEEIECTDVKRQPGRSRIWVRGTINERLK